MQEFKKGMDISFLPELEDKGMKIRDFDGKEIDAFDLAKKYGVNSIRLRLWNNPENVEESKGYCSLADTIAMAKRIKAHQMGFMLNFHYSDFWADPGKQRKPKAWEKLNVTELKEAVYTYTRDTLLTLKEEGVLPAIVQIGNEIRSGLLFPEGELPDYIGMVGLVNAGIQGARAVADSNTMKVMIHLDQGGRYFYIKDWFDRAFEAGLEDFDLIGLSYYPFWHGTFTDLKETLDKLVMNYQKPLMIVETAHAWRKSSHGFIDEVQEKIAGVPATPKGQKKVLDLVMNITASLPNQMGCGVYYWEPLCISQQGEGGWSENMGLLDENGQVMEGIHAFAFSREKLRGKEPAKVYEAPLLQVEEGEHPVLPKQLSVLYYDGTLEKKPVIWQTDLPEWTEGTYSIQGKIEGITEPVSCIIQVFKEIPVRKNLISDPNWDDGLTQWELDKSEEQVLAQLFPEFADPFPAPPLNAIRVEAPKNFTFCISQQVTITKEDYYNLQVEYKGTDTTNVEIRLFIKTSEEICETIIHPTEHEWEVYEVNHVLCKPGKITVGIKIVSPPVYGLMRKFQLYS